MAEQTVTLAPGESKAVSFEATPHEAKTYSVSVDGLTGSFRSIGAPPTEVARFVPNSWIWRHWANGSTEFKPLTSGMVIPVPYATYGAQALEVWVSSEYLEGPSVSRYYFGTRFPAVYPDGVERVNMQYSMNPKLVNPGDIGRSGVIMAAVKPMPAGVYTIRAELIHRVSDGEDIVFDTASITFTLVG